jgi:hypothetical protein
MRPPSSAVQPIRFEAANVPRKHESVVSVTARRMDRILLCLLVVLILTYGVRGLLGWVNTLYVRELLYAYLYVRLALGYRLRLTRGMLWILAFLAFSIFVGFHTFVLYGGEMAFAGLSRFINAALLAPLGAVMLRDRKHLCTFIYIWLGAVCLAAITVVYQAMGGDLSWMLGEFVGIRHDLIRFRTVVGEVNVGGMAATIAFAAALFTIRTLRWKVILIAVSAIFLVFSLSKAAIAGFASVGAVYLGRGAVAVLRDDRIPVRGFITAAVLVSGGAICGTVIVLSIPQLSEPASVYGSQLGAVFLGAQVDDGRRAGGIAWDIESRLLELTSEGFRIAQEQNTGSFIPNLIMGSSFGVAGSAAQDIRGSRYAILPHNTLSEAFLVGGFVLTLILGMVVWTTMRRLYRLTRTGAEDPFLLVAFGLLTVYSLSYPIIYQPYLGALFWLIVGSMASSFREPSVEKVTRTSRAGRPPTLTWTPSKRGAGGLVK